MPTERHATIDEIVQLARQLSPSEKLELIEQLAPTAPLSATPTANALDDQYERGYTQVPEDIADVEALLPHLAIESEVWE